MDIEKYKSWTEFEWEQEFRNEDKRIQAYIGELESCMDMPDEDKIIWDRLSRKNLQMTVPVWDDFGYDMLAFNEMEEAVPDVDKHTALYFRIGSSASEFCNFIAQTDSRGISDRLGIIYTYGRLMSVYLDIIHLEGDEFPSLKTALLKRLLSFINELLGKISSFADEPENISFDPTGYISALHKLRENIIECRFASASK